jgi:hypothetical protein
MPEQGHTPLVFHRSFHGLIDSFRTMIASMMWLRSGPEVAEKHFAPWPFVVTLDCSVSNKVVKVDVARRIGVARLHALCLADRSDRNRREHRSRLSGNALSGQE